jgi:uroporphyrin-III C-methyltransferase
MNVSGHPSDRPSATGPAPGGDVNLVGAGPGDPELLTLKAIKALRRATVVLVDDLVDPGVLRFVRRSARVVPVGKRGGCVSTPQAFIHKLMVAEATRGERVVRLKGGDPFVFGRGGEEVDALRAAGVPVSVVSGLTAGIAGPAAVGIPVTDRRCAPGVALITGHPQAGGAATPHGAPASGDASAAAGGPAGPAGPDWAALARSGLTLVIYMGVARVQALAETLLAAGLPAHRPAAVISAAHTARQRACRSTLGRLAEDVAAAGMVSPAVLVVGDVAALGDVLPQDAPQPLAHDTGVTSATSLTSDAGPVSRRVSAHA